MTAAQGDPRKGRQKPCRNAWQPFHRRRAGVPPATARPVQPDGILRLFAGLLPGWFCYLTLPAPRPSWMQLHLACPEQISHPTSERPAQLAEGPDGHILVGALDPIQGGTADAEAPRHCDLGESGGLPKAVKCLGESACEVHTEDSCSLGCPHVNIRRDAGCVAPTVVDKLRFACRRVPCLG